MDTTTGPRIVKRYTNRKLYDTQESKYVTLGDVASMVSIGQEVQVIDNLTKTDITGQTLLQAIVESETEFQADTSTLKDVIRAGGLGKFFAGIRGVVGSGG
jgi:polyhydroxyalkanoate synthesis repressor PhaR